jgi:hypothetical protein
MANPKMIARRLLRQNRGTRKIQARSWRQIAREDYNDKVGHAVIYRFATSEGIWQPKDERLQIALGLKKAKKPVTPKAPCQLIDMCVDELRKALINRQPMPEPTYNQNVMRAFIRECKRHGALKQVKGVMTT